MDGIGDQLPAGHLRIAMDARRERVALALRCHLGGFADDQTGAGPLRVIERVQRMGHIACAGATTRQRGHDDAVGQVEIAHAERAEQGVGHR